MIDLNNDFMKKKPNPKKELLSNELVQDNTPLRAYIVSETKEKLEKETEL